MSFEMKGQGFGNKGGGFGKAGGGFGPNGGGGFGAGKDGDDPLSDTEYTGYLDEDMGEQLSDLQKGFQERSQKEKDRFQRATDPEFWFAVYFATREEKEAFLQAMNLRKNVYGDRYIDGRRWAKQAGIDLD